MSTQFKNLNNFVLELTRLNQAQSLISQPEIATVSCEAVLMEQLLNHIDEHFLVSAQIGFYSKHVNKGADELNLLCRRFCGLTLRELITQRRMRYAAEMLLNSAIQIKLIALELGYDNTANFSNAFREYYQQSPKAYRNGD